MSKLFKNLGKFKSKIALIDSGHKQYSYKYILDKAKYINGKIKKGSLILIIASNNVESIIGYISFIRSNNTSILLDKSFKLDYVKKIITKYRPNYIFTPKGYLDALEKVCKIMSWEDYHLIKTN